MINALECNTFEKARQWQIEWEQEMKKEKDNHSRQTKPKINSLRPFESANSNFDGLATSKEVKDKTADTLNKGESEK